MYNLLEIQIHTPIKINCWGEGERIFFEETAMLPNFWNTKISSTAQK
jgi:hypothetical protein